MEEKLSNQNVEVAVITGNVSVEIVKRLIFSLIDELLFRDSACTRWMNWK
jgi:hypothetical protein